MQQRGGESGRGGKGEGLQVAEGSGKKKKLSYLFILDESKIVLHRASAEGQAERAKTGGSAAEKQKKKNQSDDENTSGLIFNRYDEEREESLGGGAEITWVGQITNKRRLQAGGSNGLVSGGNKG